MQLKYLATPRGTDEKIGQRKVSDLSTVKNSGKWWCWDSNLGLSDFRGPWLMKNL